MPFDWMNVTPAPARAQGENHHLRGCRERAILLRNLRYSEAEAVARIQANLRWEFDADFASTPLPDFYDAVPAMVADVYRRGLG